MSTTIRSAKTTPASWDAFADIDAFVDAVLAELARMAAVRPRRKGRPPKEPLAGAELRKAIMAIWCVAFCGVQWRAIGRLSDIPFATLFTLFARWTRLGLWRRLLGRLTLAWRRACGDTPMPSAVVIDSRTCRSAPTCFARGVDGGKRIRGIKLQLAVDKHGLPLAIRRGTSTTPGASSPFCANSPSRAFAAPPWATSATAASAWHAPGRRLRSRSRRWRAGAAAPSSRKASAGWWSGPSLGSAAIAG